MEPITIYSTRWCSDCRRVKNFLNERSIAFHEVYIEEDQTAEKMVIQVNNGKRKVPTLKMGDRYFACSPYNAHKLAEELNIPLNK